MALIDPLKPKNENFELCGRRKVRPTIKREIARNLKPRVFSGWRHALRFATDYRLTVR